MPVPNYLKFFSRTEVLNYVSRTLILNFFLALFYSASLFESISVLVEFNTEFSNLTLAKYGTNRQFVLFHKTFNKWNVFKMNKQIE